MPHHPWIHVVLPNASNGNTSEWEKNIIFCNIPESEDESAEERMKNDERRITEILQEMKAEEVRPTKVIRVEVSPKLSQLYVDPKLWVGLSHSSLLGFQNTTSI